MSNAAAVFIHGFFSRGETWTSFQELLSQDREISTNYDLRSFKYRSPLVNLDPRTRTPDLDTIALNLRTFLEVEARSYERLVIVTHSQGGLIVQRYLAEMLADGRGHELARIRRIVMFACPNSGSDFLLQWRKLLGRAWRNPQEFELRPLAETVAKVHRRIQNNIVHADRLSPNTCPIPIVMYVGESDNIVRMASALASFPDVGALPGDHSSIIQPDSASHRSYTTLRSNLQQALREPFPREKPESLPVQNLPLDAGAFIGRDKEVQYLLDAMKSMPLEATAVAIHAVDGMAGIGKTALVIHVAHLLSAKYSDRIYLDLRAHKPGLVPYDPGDALEVLLTIVGVPSAQIPLGFEGRVARWRSELANRRVLLILDNAASAEQVQPLLPGTPGSAVLITSRMRLMNLDGVVPLALKPLVLRDAVNLFRRILREARFALDIEDVAAVVERCGYLPLAIRLAAGWLQHHPARTLMELMSGMASTLGPVDSALELSYADLSHECSVLFRRLGLHPGPSFTGDTAAVLINVDGTQVADLLEELYARHLIEEPRSGRFEFHDLVRAYARRLADREDREQDRVATLRRLYEHYLQAGKRAGIEDVSWLEGELDNVLACAEDAISRDLAPYVWELPRAFAVVLQLKGLYDRARSLHMGALTAARLHGDTLAQADAHMELAVLERQVGNHETAHANIRSALDFYVELNDRKRQANAHTELGVIERDTGNYQAGREHLNWGLDMYTDLGNRVGQANANAALSSLEHETGDYDRAFMYVRRALELYREADDLLGQANCSCDFGVLNRLTGAYSEARDSLAASLLLYERLDYRIGQANVINELGNLDDQIGDKVSAQKHWEQALAIYVEIGSPDAAEVRKRLLDS